MKYKTPHSFYIPIILLLVAGLIFYSFRIEEQAEAIESKDNAITEQQSQIQYLKSYSGRVIAQKKAADIRVDELEKAYPKIAETITKEFDIKIKNLKAFVQSEFVAHGQGKSTIINNHYADSTGRVPKWTLKFNDGYLDFSSTIYDSLNAPSQYSYHDTIQFAIHQKRKWFLGKEQLFASGMLRNKGAKIIGSTSILMNHYRDKRFSVGPNVSYNFFDKKATIGVGLQYSLFKF